MAYRVRVPTVVRYLAMLLLIQVCACAGVDVVRLTNATFASKAFVKNVEVLEQESVRPHARLAVLHMDDPSLSFARMRDRLLTKAANLGEDAVVSAKPESQIEHQVTYAPIYHPWRYEGPFYRPRWGNGAWCGPWAWRGLWRGHGGIVRFQC